MCTCVHVHSFSIITSTRLQALRKAEAHLLLVTPERSDYRKELEGSKRQIMSQLVEMGVFVPPPPRAMIVPASNSIMAHYSFDFAQPVHYPSNPLQPGPISFFNT